eukprot:2540913-Prymnesium_polylepis.2
MVGLGRLLGDAVLGPPLMETDAAYIVGLKARRADAAIASNEAKLKKDASRAKSKLPPADEGSLQLEAKLQDDIAEALRKAVGVGLPDKP